MKDLEIEYYKEFINNKEAEEISSSILHNITWEKEYITIFARR